MNNLIKILFSFILIISCNDDNPISPIYGCTNQDACNFNPDATILDNTCEYSEENYDCEGNCTLTIDCAGVCGGDAVLNCLGGCGGVCGCMDSSACNYNPSASIDNNSCTYPSDDYYNCDGTCGGVNNASLDCAGVCDGDAVLSGCDNLCGSTAVDDCAGTCGGNAVVDECGVCDGDGSSCIEFTKNNGADPSLLENQDCIVDNVCLTRGNSGALYNAYLYNNYNEMLNAYDNGDNALIKWAEGTVEQAQNGELAFWNGLTNEAGNFGQLVQLPDRNIVAYLVDHDIYLNFNFLSWASSQQGGGFSYIRDVPSISEN